MAAGGAATRTRADAHKVHALHGSTVTFNDTQTHHSITPYSDHYTHHPSQIVATSDGFKLVKTHADRFTGKCVAVMDARKRRIWNRFGLEKASARREMIIRQLTDNKCLWLDACNINPCITAFIAMNAHSSQTAGSGAQNSSDHDVPTSEPEPHELVQKPQQSLRTIRAKHTVANDQLACKALNVQGARQDDPVEAPPGTDSSGRPCATSPQISVVATLADPRASSTTRQQRCDMAGRKKSGANNWSASHSISKSVSPYVSGGPQAARSSICESACSDGSLLVGGINDSKDTTAMNGTSAESGQSVRSIYVSASDFFVSDLNGYDGQDYLEAYDFTGYGYNAQVTRVVDLILAVRTPPANKNKYQKRSGAKATKKLEQLESVGHELNPKEATVFRALSARANYLAQDRVDIAYSSK